MSRTATRTKSAKRTKSVRPAKRTVSAKSGNGSGRPRLRGLSEIFAFFRHNQTPIYFLSPTSFNLLGLDRWVNGFEYVNYFDSFDGRHPKVLVPREHGPHEFRSIEDVNNYLLRHKEVRDHIKARGGGKLILVMFDEETEELARELQEFVKARLAQYKYPRRVEFTSALPRNDRGKIDRRSLK